ncbi:MAG: DUF4397 domain-containing protein [Terriglobales bacterium]
MSRWLKTMSLALAIGSFIILSIFLASCGSNNTQYRLFNAMSNPNATFNFDVTVNGGLVTGASGLGFGSAQPSTGYTGISSGGEGIAVYQVGTATTSGADPLVKSTVNLSGGNQYTVVLMGNSQSGLTPWVAQAFPDTNTLPSSGDIEFRVINAAPSLPGPVNIYIVPTMSISGATPTFTGVAYGQPSQTPTEYATLPGGQYFVYVTTSAGTPLFFPSSYNESSGIYTLVLTDVQDGFTFYTQPWLLTDVK